MTKKERYSSIFFFHFFKKVEAAYLPRLDRGGGVKEKGRKRCRHWLLSGASMASHMPCTCPTPDHSHTLSLSLFVRTATQQLNKGSKAAQRGNRSRTGMGPTYVPQGSALLSPRTPFHPFPSRTSHVHHPSAPLSVMDPRVYFPRRHVLPKRPRVVRWMTHHHIHTTRLKPEHQDNAPVLLKLPPSFIRKNKKMYKINTFSDF